VFGSFFFIACRQILHLQTVRGDELRNREIADDDDADAGQHQCRIEHTSSKSGSIAQLGEIVVVPVWIIGRQSCDADTGNHEERQQGCDGLGIHEFRLYERDIAYDPRDRGAERSQIAF
jgi:hypothetical protein